ncbi:site-specific integrase [Chryseobacterium mucoviscidosis]|uniref:site-specific integrase n=1 Tax=Paenibacillus sp. USHLN196 TaxID=3081291 RepID=UPI0009A299D7|nr:site-specific integrase [Chryseobacterium mucoviscidosis]
MKGSFYKRGNTWSYMLDVGTDPITGKRKQKSKGGFKTKKEAQAFAATILSEMNSGTYLEEKKMTFEELSDLWFESYGKLGNPKKLGTIRIRDSERKRFLQFFKKIIVSEISHDQYQQALITLKKGHMDDNGKTIIKGLADNSVSGTHATGVMIFEYGVKIGAIKNNPAKGAFIPKETKTVKDLEENNELPKYLEKDELSRFLETAKNHGLEFDYEIFNTLAYTGLRVGELCSLKENDLNFEEDKIRITKTVYNPTNRYNLYSVHTPKTKASIREIDVDPEVMLNLKDLLLQHGFEKKRKQNKYHDEGFVFARTGEYAGYPLVIKIVNNRMKRLLKLAKLNPDLSPHSLRHTHVSLLAEAGASLEQIMQRLGHSNDEITRRIYLHITKPKRKEAAQKFSELMKASKKPDDC